MDADTTPLRNSDRKIRPDDRKLVKSRIAEARSVWGYTTIKDVVETMVRYKALFL